MPRYRLIAAALGVAVLWPAAPAAALTPQPLVDITPPKSEVILCPADLGGGAGLAWQRFSETARGGDVIDLSAASLDPLTARTRLLTAGGCPSTATAASGASLIAVTPTGFTTDDPGPVFVADRSASGETSAAIAIARSARALAVAPALASNGSALVAWKEEVAARNGDEIAYAAIRDGSGAFGPRIALGPASRRVQALQAGVDDAGFGLVVFDQDVSARGGGARLVVATRAPGGAFTALRPIGAISQIDSLSLAVSPTGEALLAVADAGGVQIATGTARDGLGQLRRLAAHKATGVRVALGADGAGAVAWMLSGEKATPSAGVVVSDRPAGGDFGAPHALVAQISRPLGGDVALLRLAAAPDGRVLASWSVSVHPGDRAEAPVIVAAQRGADGVWEAAVALTGPCLQPVDAFPGFDRTGQPRVTMVQGGLISGGDYAFPQDTRVRVARLGDGAPALGPPPKVTLTARPRQILRDDTIRMRLRCTAACDARIFSVIRGFSGAASGLFPAFRRLRSGRDTAVALARAGYFDKTGHALEAEGRRVKVTVNVHACDSAGRLARARRTIVVRIPRRATRR